MTRPDLDILLSLCDEAEKADPESLKPVPADMVAVDVAGLRSLVQDAKIGRLARAEEAALQAWKAAPRSAPIANREKLWAAVIQAQDATLEAMRSGGPT